MKKITKDDALKAYQKIDNTCCLNSILSNLQFGIDTDEHIDCNSVNEMVICLDTILKYIEKSGK